MGGKANGTDSSTDFFYQTTGVGHTEGINSHEDDEIREAGLMSAMDDGGSHSNIFMT